MNNIPSNFPITIFGDSTKVSDTIEKKRVRIFYLGENRNRGYISEAFAEDLIKTLPYAPIKGIYDSEEEDFTDHGEERYEGKIYGIVPEQMNFAWEDHEDSDGVTRTYACADVYLYTALYAEASKIEGKSQSMELYRPSIQGTWERIGNHEVYKYSKASFLGLQVLGDKAIPCFEGAAFFSSQYQELYKAVSEIYEWLKGGNKQMDKPLEFTLSDNQKQNAISQALNAEIFRYVVMDSYDNYALVWDLEDDKVKKVSYTKENDNIVMGENFEEMVAEYLTSEEKSHVDALRNRTDAHTFESVEELIDTQAETVTNMQTTLNDKENEISTLNTDKEKVEAEVQELSTKIADLEAANNTLTAEKETLEASNKELQAFKYNVELEEKKAIVSKYSLKLPAETVALYTDEKLDSFSIVDLEKELAFELVQKNSQLFTLGEEQDPKFVPNLNNNSQQSSLENMIAKHKNS